MPLSHLRSISASLIPFRVIEMFQMAIDRMTTAVWNLHRDQPATWRGALATLLTAAALCLRPSQAPESIIRQPEKSTVVSKQSCSQLMLVHRG